MAKKTADIPANFPPDEDQEPRTAKKTYTVRFKENRSFELHLSTGEVLKWGPMGTNPVFPAKYVSGLSEAVINDPNFQKSREYFTVT